MSGLSNLNDKWRGKLATLFSSGAAPRSRGGHILVLNSGPLLAEVLPRLLDEPSYRRRAIVVMDANAEAVKTSLSGRLSPAAWARITFRRGDTGNPADLVTARAGDAALLLVLAPWGDDPDSAVLRTLMAMPARGGDGQGAAIVAEIRGSGAADLARGLAGGQVRVVRAGALVKRILAHSVCEPVLATIYESLLLGRDGRLLAMEQPGLSGISFGEAMLAYEEAVLLGVSDHTGRAYLGPAMDTHIQPGLRAVLFARGAVEPMVRRAEVDRAAIVPPERLPRPACRVLITGWSAELPELILEMSRIAAPGSSVTIAADTEGLAAKVGALEVSSDALKVEFGPVRHTDPSVLERLEPRSYDHLLVVDEGGDLRVPATLLGLERAFGDDDRPSVVAAVRSAEGRSLAVQAMPDVAAIYLEGLAASALLLAARTEGAAAVMADLLDAHGMQVHLRPAGALVATGKPVSFASVVAACRQHGEVAIGHIVSSEGGKPRLGVPKALRHNYRPADRIIVLAQG